jgi:hypothetical protein
VTMLPSLVKDMSLGITVNIWARYIIILALRFLIFNKDYCITEVKCCRSEQNNIYETIQQCIIKFEVRSHWYKTMQVILFMWVVRITYYFRPNKIMSNFIFSYSTKLTQFIFYCVEEWILSFTQGFNQWIWNISKNLYIFFIVGQSTLSLHILFVDHLFIITLLFYLGYIVTFPEVLTTYHIWIHLLSHSLLHLLPHSWNSFNMSYFSIFIHEHIIFPKLHLPIPFFNCVFRLVKFNWTYFMVQYDSLRSTYTVWLIDQDYCFIWLLFLILGILEIICTRFF